jgi:hypothetical protein
VRTLDVPLDGTGLLLTDCRLIDGAGNPWVRADVLVEGDCIGAIAPPGVLGGRRRRSSTPAAATSRRASSTRTHIPT